MQVMLGYINSAWLYISSGWLGQLPLYMGYQ